jgi:hypothetical protein
MLGVIAYVFRGASTSTALRARKKDLTRKTIAVSSMLFVAYFKTLSVSELHSVKW